MQRLLADTGVQLLCYPLPVDVEIDPLGWQHCRCAGPDSGQTVELPFVQWRVVGGKVAKLMLAVDTVLGPPDQGHFADRSAFVGSKRFLIAGLISPSGVSLDLPAVEFSIDPPTVGDVKDTDLVVDFGNSRTGALLLEMRGETSPTPQMLPFRLVDRGSMAAWNERGEFDAMAAETWFSARTHWCETPYLPPPILHKESFREVDGSSGWLGRPKKQTVRESETVEPNLFEDLSMARLGGEAARIAATEQATADYRSGVSSPKRYLWAADESWLEGGNWFMARRESATGDDTDERQDLVRLSGPWLRFVGERDDDVSLLKPSGTGPVEFETSPPKPRHPPRSMMTAAIYELLCQAYRYVNSQAYREATGETNRPRRLRSLTLTYPTGMLVVERDRLLKQARKAAKIFSLTAGRGHREPVVELGLDEASAVGLCYAWGELTSLGQNPGLWLSLAAKRPPDPAADVTSDPIGQDESNGRREPKGRGDGDEPVERSAASELTIACIDIGGGTSDLMIARYRCDSSVDDVLDGTIVHRDGISIAGDQLVKRLLERVIVPRFAQVVGLESSTTQWLFGPEVPRNRSIRSLRTSWMNGIFVPLAVRYLEAATSGESAIITHTDKRLVQKELLESLAGQLAVMEPSKGWDLRRELALQVDHEVLSDVVGEVFGDLFKDFCIRIVEHDSDLVLLAGQPSKLGVIRQLFRRLLPLPPSRIVAMHQHYAGNWYPYQDPQGRSPGVIFDPKSTVVVGAAVDFLARHGKLPQFQFRVRDALQSQSYYWGVMTDAVSGIREERLLFRPDSGSCITRFRSTSERVLIGRKLSPREDGEASPVYLLKADVADRLAPISLEVEIERSIDETFGEEKLEVISVEGTVAGKPARLGNNVTFSLRTLADEHYYLDHGGLDNIELS